MDTTPNPNAAGTANTRSRASPQAGTVNGNGNPALSTIEAWFTINRPMMSAMTEINGRLLEHVSRANDQWLGFVNRRFNEDLAASHRLMECRTIEELFSAYSELIQRAHSQYQAELQSFAKLNQDLAGDTAKVVMDQFDAVDSDKTH